FENRTRYSCPLDDRQLIDAAHTGLLPLTEGGKTVFVVAPRSVRQLLAFAGAYPQLQFRLTSSARLNAFIAEHAAGPLGEHAAEALLRRSPHLAAGSHFPRAAFVLAPLVAFILGGLLTIPGA